MNKSLCRPIILAVLLGSTVCSVQAEETINLWPGIAPGTENWTHEETLTESASGDRVYSNVSQPTIELFLPPQGTGNGAAVVIAPGGAMRVLGYDSGGTEIALWLNSIGVAGFVLKYRTLPQAPAQPANGPAPGNAGPPAGAPPPGFGGPRVELQVSDMPLANAIPEPDNEVLNTLVHMGIADMQQAILMIREHAEEWGIDSSRVGAMGFSAGGGVAVGAAVTENYEDGSPDFLVSLYGPSLVDVHVPDHAPPLFIAVGSEHFNVTNGLVALLTVWKKAGKPVELHVYDGVRGGFDLSERDLPVDGWNESLQGWLVAKEIIPE